jgi:uncharacterized protein with PQ loop repeat
MSIPLHDPSRIVKSDDSEASGGLQKVLRFLSVATMLMTVPQVLTIWISRDASGVSLVAWASYLLSACLWFVYGLRRKDKTIYLACVGWIVLDASIVIGVVVHS